MKKLTLSLLLALGITGAYANNFYAGMGGGINPTSNNTSSVFSATLGYEIDTKNEYFFIDNGASYLSLTGSLIKNYNGGFFNLLSQNSVNAFSGIGYNLNESTALKLNAGIQYTSSNYQNNKFINENSVKTIGNAVNYNYLSPFLKLSAIFNVINNFNLVVSYQYTLQKDSFSEENKNIPLAGENIILAGLQYNF